MSTRQAIYKDCQKCNEPPNCGVAPERCNIQVEPEPVIEKGDTVRKKSSEFPSVSKEARVIGIEKMDQLACIQWPDGSMQIRNICDLTLVRKGPKSETFRGVKFTIDEGLKVDCILNQISILSPNKTYKMTLVEEEREPKS